MLTSFLMHLDFLSVCAHRDISTGSFTSTNSLLGHARFLSDWAPPAPVRLQLLLDRHIRWPSPDSCTTERELLWSWELLSHSLGNSEMSVQLWRRRPGRVTALAIYAFFKEKVTA